MRATPDDSSQLPPHAGRSADFGSPREIWCPRNVTKTWTMNAIHDIDALSMAIHYV
jgi:hypothetical protein